jgi:outer membrane protein TolC
MVLPILLALSLLLVVEGSRAEEAPPSDSAADLTRVELLDEVPDYAEILESQWSVGVPSDGVVRAEAREHFGRLIEEGPSESITLQEAVALTLKNNTQLQIQRLTPISAAAGVREARSIFDPAFFADASKLRRNFPFASVGVFTSGQTPEGEPTPGPTPVAGIPPKALEQDVVWNAGVRKTLLSGGQLAFAWTNHRLSLNSNVINLLVPRYETALDLSLNQPLLRDFGWRFALLRVDVAQNLEQQTYQQYKAAIADIVLAVERSYWTLVTAIEDVRVEEQGLELARELERQNEGRFKVGAMPRTAVLEAQAEVARRRTNLVAAQNRERNARDQLRAIINYREPDTDMLLMVEPADEPTVLPYDIDLDRSLQTARENRPELQAARLNVGGKKIERKIAENQLLPRLDFVGSIGVNGLGGNAAGPASEFSQPNPQVLGGYDRSLELLTDGRFYQYLAGAQLEVPIANAAAKAQYAQAKVDAERASLSLFELEENVTVEVKRAITNLESLVIGIESTRIARELAEENLRNQQARYDVGLATTKDLLDFQDRLTSARALEIIALTGYRTALAELWRAQGTLLEERGILVERHDPEQPSWWARF